MATLNLDRGVMHRFHPNGMRVNMYIDDPGTYLTDTCELVAAEIAKAAGYPIEKLKIEKLKKIKMAEFKAQLDSEMRVQEDAIAAAVSNSGAADVRHVGGGQYAIFTKDGSETRVLMSRADLEMLGIKVPEEAQATLPGLVAA